MSENKQAALFRQKLELLILSQSEEVLQRAKQVISAHHFTFRQLPFAELPVNTLGELLKAQAVLLTQESQESSADFAQRVDQVLVLFPRSKVVAIMAAAPAGEPAFANTRVTPLSQAEFFTTLKFEYLCLYLCRLQYFDIQASDLFPMTRVTFPAFVRLSLNQRYLAVVYSNMVLSDERFARLGQAEGLFIRGKDSEKYCEYIYTYYDTSGAGLKKRARALFLTLYAQSLQLNETLLFDYKTEDEQKISELFAKLRKTAEDLFAVLKGEENLWDVFREALSGDFTLYWRAPWIAVYAALMAIKSGQGEPMTVLLSALLTDAGIYDLQEVVTRQFLLSDDKDLREEPSFRKHPILSLNRCLIKKLPIDEKVKSVIVCTHEKFDEKGFPNQVPAAQLPVEAQLILFAEKVDQGVLTTMKQTGVGFRFLKEKIWETEKTQSAFRPEFLTAIAESLL